MVVSVEQFWPQETLAMSGGNADGRDWGVGCCMLGPGILLNGPQCTRHLQQNKTQQKTNIIWSKVSAVLRFKNPGFE